MKLKKKEVQSVDTLILIGKWIKIPTAHSQPIVNHRTNRHYEDKSIVSPMEQLEKGPKELKRFAVLQEEQ